MLTVFCSPSRYTQGKNATLSLGREMAGLGLAGPALIVAGNTAISLLSDTWQRSLGEAAIAYQVCRFGGECSISEIERVKRHAQRSAPASSSAPAEVRCSTLLAPRQPTSTCR